MWASPRTQAIRFKALLRAVYVPGKSVMDVGCGRADFLEFMLNAKMFPRSYVGLEAVEDLAAAAEKKRLPLCKIIRGDFVQDPSLLVIDADVLFYSGSLNTMNEQSFYDCLRAGFAAAKLGIAFNFLSSKSLAASPHLTWHQSDKVRDFAQTLSSRVSFWDDYLPGDSTIAIWKEKP